MSRQSRGVPLDINGTLVTATADELNQNTGATAGTGVAGKAMVLDSGEDFIWPATGQLTYGGTAITASGAELNYMDGTILADFAPGSGIVAGADFIESTVVKVGLLFKTEIVIDISGLNEGDTDADVIGNDADAPASHLGQIVTATNGVIFAGKMECLEAPGTAAPNIDLYSNDTSLAQDVPVTGGANATALVTAGGAWTVAEVQALTLYPATSQYLYLAVGEAATDADYTAGIFVITLWGK
jgi:hypothetical protein